MVTPTPDLELLPNYFVNARFIASDMDGTLTQNGHFAPPMLRTLAELATAGWPVMIVTGRSAGWVHGVANYLPVVGAIAENGGVFCLPESTVKQSRTTNGGTDPQVFTEVNILSNLSDVASHRQKLADTFHQIQGQYPHLEEAADNQFRLTDWTFDVQGLTQHDIEAIAQFCQDQGWSFTYSTVQCHIKPQGQDKATAVRSVLKQFFPDINRSQVVTIGDSPNDVSLFDPEQFTCSVGVANIAKYRDRLQHFPRHLTQGAEAEGFCELAHALINQHIQASE